MDLIIDPQYQGKGLVEFMWNDLNNKSLQKITLKTKNAHTYYEKYGFNSVGDSSLYMAMDKQILE